MDERVIDNAKEDGHVTNERQDSCSQWLESFDPDELGKDKMQRRGSWALRLKATTSV